MILENLFGDVGEIRVEGDRMIDITAIKYDSRRVAPGDLFAAVAGENFDGTQFISEAAAKGARAFLVPADTNRKGEGTYVYARDVRKALAMASRNLFHDPAARIKVVGITGTNGKTTTSYLVHGILEASGKGCGLIGTVQYLVGGQVLSAARTTPESTDLFALLDGMIKAGSFACVLEVSSHALALQRVFGLQMEVGVFMNLTRDHLDFHRDMESYFRAKASLFETEQVRNRVINLDDPYGARLLKESDHQGVTFGMERGDIRLCGKVEGDSSGSRFVLDTPWGEIKVNTALPGKFNIYNIMAAVGTCGLLGLEPKKIARGLSLVNRVPGRFERVDRGQSWTAVVDYAHTPDALKNLLENARFLTRERVIVIFGCGGDRDRSKRALMGETASRLADLIFVTSDNPRGEDPETIIDEIMTGLENSSGKAVRITDRRKAIAMAVREAKPGDVLLLAGKGHENFQVIGERILPFSDLDELTKAIDSVTEGEL